VLVLQEIPFSDFVAARSPRLLHLAYLLTRDRGQAEDLLQTALARAWPAWGRINDPEAYVRRIMVTTYSAWWRRKWNGEVPTDRLPERIDADPHQGIDAREEMLAALRRLPRQQRAVLVLRYYEDLSDVDIAEILNIAPGTVRSHIHRALTAMRLDATLAASTLQPPTNTPSVALSAVMLRVAQHRRRRIAAITAACLAVVVLLLGYAMSPHRRTAPPPANQSPIPQVTPFGPFAEYESGTQMLNVVALLPGHSVTFQWTPNGLDAFVRLRCSTEQDIIVTLRLRLNNGEPWDDGGCRSGDAPDSFDAKVSAQRQGQSGLREGVPATLSVELSPTAFNGAVMSPFAHPASLPSNTQAVVGFAIAVPWEQYSFPPKRDVPTPNPTQMMLFGKPLIASAPDPMRSQSATMVWDKTKKAMVWVGAPIQLDVLVNGELYTTCSGWAYEEVACGFDLGPDSSLARDGLGPARGSTVTVTVLPVHAANPWSLYLTGDADPIAGRPSGPRH
jgi:RNA polymerase sigma-70 factor (sigma-E family)